MSKLNNRVNLIGNIGNAPEVKTMENGTKLVRCSIATNDSYKNDKGEKVTQTEWHNLVFWGKIGDIVESYVKKGSLVSVEGKLTHSSYEDKDGVKRYSTEIKVNDILLLDSKA